MDKIRNFEMVQCGLCSGFFFSTVMHRSYQKEAVDQFLLIFYDQTLEKLFFGFFAPGGECSKSTAYRYVNLSLVTVKDITLTFCSIHYFSLETFVSNLNSQRRNIGQKLDIFQLRDILNKSCHNSRTSNDIDMKLEPVTKLTRQIGQREKK